MEMEELTREEAICRHRLTWNWIADEAEKTGEPIDKSDAFKHFGWDGSKVLSSCWCCEWAHWERNLDLYKDNFFKSLCFYCPLDWSNGEKEILEATCSTITSNDGHTKDGLYDQWCFETSLPGDPIKASKIARIIANLPEKKEVKEDD